MKRFFYLTALLISLVLASCESKDEQIKRSMDYTVNIDTPLDLSDATINHSTIAFTNISTNEKYSFTTDKHTLTVNILEGQYNIDVVSELEYSIDGTKVEAEFQGSQKGVFVNETSNSSTILLSSESNINNGLVIEEIFFTGTLTPEGKQYSGDQYFKITNNSSSVVYADSVAILESSFLTVSKYEYTPNIMDKAFTVDAVYMIPGKGSDVPVQPGKSLIIALNAINHKTANSNSINLENADYEFYDESSNPNYMDVDNSSVPNLDKWYCNTATYFSLHNRGFKSYAIAKMKTTKEDFLANHYYEAKYNMTLPTGNFEMSTKGYKVPNAWILDAVNLSVESVFEWIVTSPSLDMGWTYCGKIDQDKTRYGKSVRRVANADGTLKDTNNSSVDFTPEAKPSLFE